MHGDAEVYRSKLYSENQSETKYTLPEKFWSNFSAEATTIEKAFNMICNLDSECRRKLLTSVTVNFCI